MVIDVDSFSSAWADMHGVKLTWGTVVSLRPLREDLRIFFSIGGHL